MCSSQEIVSIDGIDTHVYRLGDQSTANRTIIIIPGNPGLGGFYIPFAHQLFDSLSGRESILIVSQAGHSPSLKRCFTLNEQIEHKLKAIESLVPQKPNHRLILIGHSIGSFMTLKMLDRLNERYDRAFLLFPTIEQMSISDAGKSFQRFYPFIIYLFPFLCWLIHWLLPFESMKKKLISFYFSQSPSDDRPFLVDTVANDLLNSTSMRNILQMAKEEMNVVQQRPDDIIRRHLAKLTFYYGVNDHWVPNTVPRQMKETYPHGDIVLCQNKYLHAFVVKHSRELAKFVFHRLRSI